MIILSMYIGAHCTYKMTPAHQETIDTNFYSRERGPDKPSRGMGPKTRAPRCEVEEATFRLLCQEFESGEMYYRRNLCDTSTCLISQAGAGVPQWR